MFCRSRGAKIQGVIVKTVVRGASPLSVLVNRIESVWGTISYYPHTLVRICGCLESRVVRPQSVGGRFSSVQRAR